MYFCSFLPLFFSFCSGCIVSQCTGRLWYTPACSSKENEDLPLLGWHIRLWHGVFLRPILPSYFSCSLGHAVCLQTPLGGRTMFFLYENNLLSKKYFITGRRKKINFVYRIFDSGYERVKYNLFLNTDWDGKCESLTQSFFWKDAAEICI